MLLKRIKCLICDLGLICLLYYLFSFINPFDLPLVNFFFCFVGIYFLITFFMLKRSLFQYLFQIEIPQKQLRYVLFKVLFLSLIPWVLSLEAGYHSLPHIAVVLLAANILSCIVKRKSVWEWCAKTRVEISKPAQYTKLITRITLGMVAAVFVGNAVQYIVFVQKGKETVTTDSPALFYYLHVNQAPIPVSQIRQRQYIKDIRQHKQEPFEYIMQLFENHDIVVLCERMHPEYTQWELFSQLIFNDTFASKVGNVATEFGCINDQPLLDSLLNTTFCSEEERKKAFAFLVRSNGGAWPLWGNTNIYDFSINLSKFNEKQEENRKINWFFCDVARDWAYINNRKDWEDTHFNNHGIDSIMAYHIATGFESLNKRGKRSKLLVIENTHHAYKEYREGDETMADYLYQQYGDKVAFVWINNESVLAYEFYHPYQMGLLDGAAAQIEDTAWALSFSSSILGEDHFELLPHIDKKHLKMKELFDGMIYYNLPVKQYLKLGYDYMLADFKDTLLKRIKIVFGEKEGEEITRDVFIQFGSGEHTVRIVPYFLIYNAIYYLFQLFILSWLAGCLIGILKREKKG